MILGSYDKQPVEVETYTINYSLDLNQGDRVTGSVATVEPNGLTVGIATIENSRVRIRVSGGTNNVRYKVTTTTETLEGRVMQDEFFVKVKDL